MHDGRLVRQGPLGALLQLVAPELFIRTDDIAKTLQTLRARGYAPTTDGNGVRLQLRDGDSEAAAINGQLVAAGLAVAELSLRQTTLETLYMSVQPRHAEAA